MTIHEALEKGISKLKLPEWAFPEDHIELNIISGKFLAPWVNFYSPGNEIAGNKNPMDLPITEVDKETRWEEWERS